MLPPRLGCGSWVSATMKGAPVLKAVLIGVSSHDISSFWIQTGDLGLLKDDRVEIYPYSHPPSSTFLKKIPKNISVETKTGFLFNRIRWSELRGKDLSRFFSDILKRLPAKRVYISIDKDCLRREYALTNWEEGMMSLEELLLMLRLIRENLDIAGVDILGDYSEIDIKGVVKGMASRLDHPKDFSARGLTESCISARNEETNLRITDILIP